MSSSPRLDTHPRARPAPYSRSLPSRQRPSPRPLHHPRPHLFHPHNRRGRLRPAPRGTRRPGQSGPGSLCAPAPLHTPRPCRDVPRAPSRNPDTRWPSPRGDRGCLGGGEAGPGGETREGGVSWSPAGVVVVLGQGSGSVSPSFQQKGNFSSFLSSPVRNSFSDLMENSGEAFLPVDVKG